MSGLFGIARTALTAHQTALQTISQNIANSETVGYSRQEALLEANTPLRMPYGNIGTGVSVTTIGRKRDLLLDDSFRSANSQAGQTGLRRDLLQQLENVFGEPSDAGMSAALDNFFNAWSDLATSPSSGAAKSVVQQRGRQLAQLFNDYDTQLSAQRTSALSRLNNTVSEINSIASTVAEMNTRIVAAEAGGHTANDLRDQRDLALDRLSQLAGARVLPQANGSVSVIVGNSTLVDGDSARPLIVELVPPTPAPAYPPSDIPVRIRLGNSPDALKPLSGEIASLTQFINSDIPEVRSRLDALASAVVSAVNGEHTQNFTFSGNTIPGTAAGNFFDPGSLANPARASTIRLHDDIAADATKIAVSRDANAPLDNAGGRALSSLRDLMNGVSFTNKSNVVETDSFLGFFRTLVSRLGLDVKTAGDDATVQQTLADQAERRRQSVSGVNTDEELVNMLRVQQAYTAATKLIKTADDMLQTLLSLV